MLLFALYEKVFLIRSKTFFCWCCTIHFRSWLCYNNRRLLAGERAAAAAGKGPPFLPFLVRPIANAATFRRFCRILVV